MPTSATLFNMSGTGAQTVTRRLLGKGPFDLRLVLTLEPDESDPYASLVLETSHDGVTWWPVGQTPTEGGTTYTVQPSIAATLKATYPSLPLMEWVRATMTPSATLAWTAQVVVTSPKPVAVLESA
jgi:hypothetical protein